jgi:hypothetical protein
MSRYKVHGDWTVDGELGPRDMFFVMFADALDTKTGDVFRAGAYRVVDAYGKPAVKGKGGTVPFYGESAWSNAARLAEDLTFAARRAS